MALTPQSDPTPIIGQQPASGTSVPLERWEDLSRLLNETAAAHQRLGRALKEWFTIDPAACAEFDELSRLLSDLQDWAMRTQQVPVSTITDQFHRVVSDLARTQGKHVRWQTHGTDTAMDRGVLRQLADSLMQLIRNALDHGIEFPEERVRAGKRTEGTIRLRAMELDSDVVISVTDDGRGIERNRGRPWVKRRKEGEELWMTFQPGFRPGVTDVSGRGVGLDRVRTNVDAVHGRVEVQSHAGAGTEFRIVVPINTPVLRGGGGRAVVSRLRACAFHVSSHRPA